MQGFVHALYHKIKYNIDSNIIQDYNTSNINDIIQDLNLLLFDCMQDYKINSYYSFIGYFHCRVYATYIGRKSFLVHNVGRVNYKCGHDTNNTMQRFVKQYQAFVDQNNCDPSIEDMMEITHMSYARVKKYMITCFNMTETVEYNSSNEQSNENCIENDYQRVDFNMSIQNFFNSLTPNEQKLMLRRMDLMEANVKSVSTVLAKEFGCGMRTIYNHVDKIAEKYHTFMDEAM